MISWRALKNYILSSRDMDFAGACRAQALDGEPERHRPDSLLRGCRTVIVFGRKMIDGAVQSAFRVWEEGHMSSQTSYADHASYLAVNMLLMRESYELAQYIEKRFNAAAVPMPNNVIQDMEPEGLRAPFFADPYRSGMPLDLAKAAVAAGLGEIGWSRRFISPDYGPRVNLCAVLTDAELDEYDEPYFGERLCDPEKCGVCREMCPVDAIPEYAPENGEEFSICGAAQRRCRLDVNACTVACMGMMKRFNPRARDVVPSLHPTDEELRAGIDRLNAGPGMQMLDHLPGFYCDRCLQYCPVGGWDEKYRKRGLSGGGRK